MDTLIEEIGAFGKFQKILLLIIGATAIIPSFGLYSTIFTTASPDLICKNKLLNESSSMKTCEMWENYTKSLSSNNKSPFNCEFDKTHFGTTIVTDWNLVCDRVGLTGFVQTSYLFGVLFSCVSGSISDIYGRKKSTLVFIVLFIFFSFFSNILMSNVITLSITTRYVIFNLIQSLTALCYSSIYNCGYTLLIELTTDEYHTLFSNINIYLYIFGEIIIMTVYYFSREWKTVYWFVTAYGIATLIPFILFAPESPRWLTARGRFGEAKEVLKRVAKINSRELKTDSESIELLEKDFQTNSTENANKKSFKKELYENFLYPYQNFFKMLALFITYNAVIMNYVGVTVGITTLININPYATYILSSIFEFSGIIFCHLNDKTGRKKGLFIQIIIMSTSLLLIGFLPDSDHQKIYEWSNIIKIILYLIAKMMVSAAFNTIIVFSAELYYTEVRTTAITLMGSFGFLASLIAPQVNLLSTTVWRPLPYLIYSSVGFISAAILSFMPETYVKY